MQGGFLAAPANVPIGTHEYGAVPFQDRSASEVVLPFADRVTETMCHERTSSSAPASPWIIGPNAKSRR
jgi:hypothetical protein